MTGSADITATGVTRRYGAKQALGGVDLEVSHGEIVAILGPNGAGKTTLVEILEGLRCRDGGDVSVLGEDPESATSGWRARIGAVLQLGLETDEFRVGELLSAHAAYYPRSRTVTEVVSMLDLSSLMERKVSALSGGQRRRLDIGLGVVGAPELLFLDEPTTGLDPEVRRAIWNLIRVLADEGTTVVLTSHYLDEVEHLADRTVVLIDGAVSWHGPTTELGRNAGRSTVSFRLRPRTGVCDLPSGWSQDRVVDAGGLVRVPTDDPSRLVAELMAWANAVPGGNPVDDLEVSRPTLEDAYLALLDSTHTERT